MLLCSDKSYHVKEQEISQCRVTGICQCRHGFPKDNLHVLPKLLHGHRHQPLAVGVVMDSSLLADQSIPQS